MDKETIIWTDAKGVEYILTDQEDISITIGPSGRYMPPIEYQEEEIPYQPGSQVKQVRVKARTIDFPIEINGITQMDVRNKLRELLRWFNPLKGDGRIKSISPDGSQREINCRYLSGLEIKESGQRWERFVLVLKAFDPYWYDINTMVHTFKINESLDSFFPVPPLRLASSTVFADITIDNTGDVETWPEWIITGPGENILLRNITTGEFTELVTSIGEGETITINTKPLKRNKIRKNDGTNLFHTQTDSSSLWSLKDGLNSIRIEMTNATVASSVQLSYKHGYWGP